jgi:hypothetical protein
MTLHKENTISFYEDVISIFQFCTPEPKELLQTFEVKSLVGSCVFRSGYAICRCDLVFHMQMNKFVHEFYVFFFVSNVHTLSNSLWSGLGRFVRCLVKGGLQNVNCRGKMYISFFWSAGSIRFYHHHHHHFTKFYLYVMWLALFCRIHI